jgi:hypothetical protein
MDKDLGASADFQRFIIMRFLLSSICVVSVANLFCLRLLLRRFSIDLHEPAWRATDSGAPGRPIFLYTMIALNRCPVKRCGFFPANLFHVMGRYADSMMGLGAFLFIWTARCAGLLMPGKPFDLADGSV